MPQAAAAPAPAAEPAARGARRSRRRSSTGRCSSSWAKLLTNGKPELLARVINLYLVESPKLMQKLKQAAGASDAPEIARSAHSLKSSSANVGAKGLSRYCADIEASARRADTEEARRIFAKSRPSMIRFRAR